MPLEEDTRVSYINVAANRPYSKPNEGLFHEIVRHVIEGMYVYHRERYI